MEPIFLVDGSGYIFRAFYAIAPLSNSKGLPTNALYGFTRMMVKLLRDVSAKYIIVAFDTGEPTFRHKEYAEYKANRDECPADLVPQMPHFRAIVRALGIQSLEKPGVEADDIIGTLTKKFSSPQQKIIIVSGDKDLSQLVTDNVEVWDAMRDVHFTPAAVLEKFGVHPNQIVDYLALVGDSSDNVPGAKGIGPKTAQQLIAHFGSLESLLAGADKIEQIPGLRGAKTVQQKIEQYRDQIRLSARLVSLDLDVAPFNSIQSVEELAWHGADPDIAAPLFDELELNKLVATLPFRDGAVLPAAQQNETQSLKRYTLVTRETLQDFVQKLSAQKEFSFDTETTSLNVRDCGLVGMSLSWHDHEAYYLPLSGTAEPERHLDPVAVRNLLGPIFDNPEIRKIGLNLKFDISVLAEQGYSVRGVAFDSMLASYVLDSDSRQHGLSALSRAHLQESMIEFEDLTEGFDNIGEVAIDRVCQYACHDADVAWRLRDILDHALGEHTPNEVSLRTVFERVEMPLVPVLSAIERKGIKVDPQILDALATEFKADLKRLEADIYQEAGGEFNLNSPKQMSEVLFQRLGIPTTGVRKTQTSFSTDASVLEKLAPKYPVVNKILEYREVFKLMSTYVESLGRLIDPRTRRIHTSFNQAVTATGRLSSSDPNLQNIPIRGTRGRRIRSAFVAEPGNTLVSADYSQIELRVLAHMCGDENLQNAFRGGKDIHAQTAQEIFGGALISPSEMSDLRRVAKTINFGIIYGMGAFRLADQLGVSRAQAQKYIDGYFGRYPRVREYFEQVEREIEERGYCETLFGRRRHRGNIDISGRDAGYARRSLQNFPIQGSAAEIMKLAMIRVHHELEVQKIPAWIVLQVHDELIVETAEDRAEEVRDLVVREMEQAAELSVPLKVDVRVSNSWGGGI